MRTTIFSSLMFKKVISPCTFFFIAVLLLFFNNNFHYSILFENVFSVFYFNQDFYLFFIPEYRCSLCVPTNLWIHFFIIIIIFPIFYYNLYIFFSWPGVRVSLCAPWFLKKNCFFFNGWFFLRIVFKKIIFFNNCFF